MSSSCTYLVFVPLTEKWFHKNTVKINDHLNFKRQLGIFIRSVDTYKKITSKFHINITYISSSKIYRKYELVLDMLSSMNNNCNPWYKSTVSSSLMVCIFVWPILISYWAEVTNLQGKRDWSQIICNYFCRNLHCSTAASTMKLIDQWSVNMPIFSLINFPWFYVPNYLRVDVSLFHKTTRTSHNDTKRKDKVHSS